VEDEDAPDPAAAAESDDAGASELESGLICVAALSNTCCAADLRSQMTVVVDAACALAHKYLSLLKSRLRPCDHCQRLSECVEGSMDDFIEEDEQEDGWSVDEDPIPAALDDLRASLGDNDRYTCVAPFALLETHAFLQQQFSTMPAASG